MVFFVGDLPYKGEPKVDKSCIFVYFCRRFKPLRGTKSG